MLFCLNICVEDFSLEADLWILSNRQALFGQADPLQVLAPKYKNKWEDP
jgi:hypothetical protein